MDRVYVMQLVRSFQVGELSRRVFLRRATLAIGSATAANALLAACAPRPDAPPVVEPEPTAAAASAPTDAPPAEPTAAGAASDGLTTYGELDGQTLTGYVALPAGDAPAPGVVLIQEWWGLDAHIKGIADRLAGEGFAVIAPDLYHGVSTTEPDEARKLVMALDREAAVAEIERAGEWLLDQPRVAGPKVGAVGFCMGGMLVLRTALVDDDLGAAVAFYGTPLTDEEAARAKAPILGLYGADDGGIPVDAVSAMDMALAAAGVEHHIEVYDGAPHAFFNDTRPDSYRPEAAADAWSRTLAWFRDHLEADA